MSLVFSLQLTSSGGALVQLETRAPYFFIFSHPNTFPPRAPGVEGGVVSAGMSAARLADAIKRSGYPEAVDARSLEWLFGTGNERKEAFLTWLCDAVGPDRVVLPADMQAFTRLSEASRVLEGAALDEAMVGAEVKGEAAAAKLRLEAAQLDERLAVLEREHKLAIRQRNLLAAQRDALAPEAKSLRLAVAEQSKAVESSAESAENALRSFGASLDGVVGACAADPGAALSRIDGKEYEEAEEAFARAADLYWSRQFHADIESALKSEDSGYARIDPADARALRALCGADADELDQISKEMSRLQNAYAKSMLGWIRAGEALSGALARSDEIKAQTAQRARNKALSPEALAKETGAAQRECAEIAQRRAAVRKEAARLVEELQALQTQPVVVGNAQLKCARYGYYLSKVERLYREVVGQVARRRLLLKGLRVEEKRVREREATIAALSGQLRAELAASKARSLRYRVLRDRSELRKQCSNTVDRRDRLLMQVGQVIGVDGATGDAGFISYAGLGSAARALSDSWNTSDAAGIESKRADMAKRLGDSVTKLTRLATGRSAKEPAPLPADVERITLSSLRPSTFDKALAASAAARERLAPVVESLRQDYKEKGERLRSAADRSMRGLFIEFFTQKQKMVNQYKALQARIREEEQLAAGAR